MENKYYNKVIIIDDSLGAEDLKKNISQTYRIENGQIKEDVFLPNNKDSHADICAKIIKRHVPEVQIINIIVKNNWQNGCVEDFLKGLEFCQLLDADLINISVGTTEKKNILQMRRVVRLLTDNKVIVAAKSNDMKKTYPSSFKNVIECSLDQKIRFPFHFSIDRDKLIKNDSIIRSNEGKLCLLTPCNSYLAASVSGLILEKMNEESLNQQLR